jgi:5-methylcytosine-specific restriction enzyme subunit McrC
MARLFEAFVRNFYKLEQNKFRSNALRISWHAKSLDEQSVGFLPEMQTDLCLMNENRKIILDCKYYKRALQRHWNRSTLHSAHLYQLYAYLRNKEIEPGWEDCEGMLLYPTVNQTLELNYTTGGHKVMIRTLDLNQEWTKIKRDMLNLIGVIESPLAP